MGGAGIYGTSMLCACDWFGFVGYQLGQHTILAAAVAAVPVSFVLFVVVFSLGARLVYSRNWLPRPRCRRRRRKFLKQFPTSGRYRRMLAQAEMESGDWQAADKVRFEIGRKELALVAFVCFCSHPLVCLNR